ncbi:hypothetical protein HK104_004387 [Borealophlyctis nickersoniae]|nr:hypothetical protein HK104_004387 [Borealophlyctis nickersoniae]
MTAGRHHIRLPESFTSARTYVEALVAFLRIYGWLWEHHAVDFYVTDYWNVTFPAEWRVLKDPSNTLNDLLQLASHGRVKDEWPASLKEFVRLSRAIALPRDPEGDPFVRKLESESRPLDNKVTYGMTPKKKHEVQILSSLIASVAAANDTPNVLDIGAGQGYLDAVLAYSYGLTVIGVDDDEVQTCGAKRRSTKMFKGKKRDNAGRVHHINRRVGAGETFENLLREAVEETGVDGVSQPADADEKDPLASNGILDEPAATPARSSHSRWMLCGLHTCGDLAAVSIRHFLESDAAVLVGVGCCYNHLTEAPNANLAAPPSHWESSTNFQRRRPPSKDAPPGFPMSAHVASLSMALGFTARMLACQATCRWAEQPDAAENFSRHFYRALLQAIIKERNLLPEIADSRDIIVGRLGRDAFRGGFVAYAEQALPRLGIDTVKFGLTREALEEFRQRFRDREKEIAVVWTLRAMLAEAIESLILVDRFLSLVEASGEGDVDGGATIADTGDSKSLEVQLFPIFQPIDSPRNMVIVARKLNKIQNERVAVP